MISPSILRLIDHANRLADPMIHSSHRLALSPELVERVRVLYLSGLSQKEVGVEVGLHQWQVWKLMAREGIPRRGHGPRPERAFRGAKGRPPRSPVERFWERVNKDGPMHPILGTRCWVWTGNKGYGVLEHLGQTFLAHRFSWELHNGPIPEGLYALHHCDNPPCVNPEHLYLGTQTDNNRDRMVRGRGKNQNIGKTHCRRGHFFSEENTIRKKDGARGCRICSNIYQRERWRTRSTRK